MPRLSAARELLAPPEDVWRFVAEPYNLPDWWPGIAGVQPDRLGLAPGARWRVQRSPRPGLLRRPGAEGLLLVRAVEPPSLLAFHLTGERLDVELRLARAGPERTRAELDVAGTFLLGPRRTLPRLALRRVHDLCQTGADAPS